MSIEAFIWNYEDGEPADFDFKVVCDILSAGDSDWDGEFGRLRVRFHSPDDDVEIFLDKDGPITNRTRGIMVSRPIVHPDFLKRVFRVMELGNVMLFYSDETTPIFVRGADPKHYPKDLLDELGEPRFVASPEGLLHQS